MRGAESGRRPERTRAAVRAAVLLLLFAAVTGCGGRPSPAEVERGEPRLTAVVTRTPDHERVVDRVALPADLLPLRRATLAAEVAGVVERLGFDEASRVEEGQVLAEIDTRALEQALAEAEAVHRQARVNFETAERLLEKRTITNTQFLQATTERDVAEARLENARLQVAKSRVRAPWSGVVSEKHVEVGDYVVPGQPVAELVDIRRLIVRAPASASDVPFLEVGQRVAITVDGLPDETFEGRIVRLGAELDPSDRTLDVEAEITNEGRLRPGMVGRMTVPRRVIEDALLVPLDSLIELEDETVVYVVEDGVARRRSVELGPVLGERVVVVRGLEVDDRVIVEGRLQVAEGQPVEERPAEAEEATGGVTGARSEAGSGEDG